MIFTFWQKLYYHDKYYNEFSLILLQFIAILFFFFFFFNPLHFCVFKLNWKFKTRNINTQFCISYQILVFLSWIISETSHLKLSWRGKIFICGLFPYISFYQFFFSMLYCWLPSNSSCIVLRFWDEMFLPLQIICVIASIFVAFV